MITLTTEQLQACFPQATKKNIDLFLGPLNAAMERYDINANAARAAAFLAQIGHESGQLRWVRELASGATYDTGKLAERLGNTPEDDDDGERYKGRGLIQVTGTTNYRQCSIALFGNPQTLLDNPTLLELPEHAAMSAAWYWNSRGLNAFADRGAFEAITKIINGGLNGLAERKALWSKAKEVIQ